MTVRAGSDFPMRLRRLAGLAAAILAGAASATPLDKAPPVDVCALVAPDQVRPIVTQQRFEIRSKAEKPKPGHGICTWSAHDPALIASAPPAASVAAEVYRSDDPAWMAKNFAKDFAKSLVPSQVRTGDAGDLVARPKPDSVAVRHGGAVVVVGASGQQYALQRAPDRIYQLEAFAFRLAGATVQGPADPRTAQDACTPLDRQHVLGILTTEPSSLEITRDGTRCTLQVKDGSGKIGHWVDNRGEVQIERVDVATNAEALHFQHQQTPFLPISTLVHTADPTDRLVTAADHPGEAWAVHGANYVTFEVEDETPAARSTPGWVYRVQRLAFEAAGATIVPTAETPRDPVVPGPVPEDSETEPATKWAPPAHPAPALSPLIDPIIAVIAFLAAYRMILMPVFIGGPIVLLVIGANRAKRNGTRNRLGALPAIVIPLGILNIMVGPWLASVLVYHAGVSGSAIITGSHATGVQYNNHDVRAHTVLIRAPDGRVVESSFADDDFNVYPSHNQTYYPGKGDAFTVRFLQHAPRTFVIVANDDSPWARQRRCAKIEQTRSDAESKARFAPADARYKALYDRASADARAAGCSDSD